MHIHFHFDAIFIPLHIFFIEDTAFGTLKCKISELQNQHPLNET